MADLEAKIVECQRMDLEAKKIVGAQASLGITSPFMFSYTEAVAADMIAHSKICVKVEGILKKALMNRANAEKVGDMVAPFKAMVDKYAMLRKVAEKFALVGAPAKGGKRKGKSE